MKSNGKSAKSKFKKPSGFLYFIAYCLAAPFLKFKCKAVYDKSGIGDLKGPALILCPHVSNIDFMLIAVALYPERPTFVVSQHFMAKPAIRWFLTKMQVIPKKMFCPDIKTIISIMRAKENNRIIVLFPEGRLPAVGHSLQITDGTAELIKKMGVNVYIMSENGAYKAFPKWGKAGMRSGRIEVTSSKLFTPEQIADMSVEQIQEALAKAIEHDEDKLLTDVQYKCKRPALGLDGVLYKCPECKAEFSMTSDDHHITCGSCGFSSRLDMTYRLHGGPFEHINDWYFWQDEQIDLDTPLESATILATPGQDGNLDRKAGEGTVRLDRHNIRFKGTCFGEPLEFTEPTSAIKALPFSVGDHFDLYHNKIMYNFILQPDPRQVVKWSMYMDKLFR